MNENDKKNTQAPQASPAKDVPSEKTKAEQFQGGKSEEQKTPSYTKPAGDNSGNKPQAGASK